MEMLERGGPLPREIVTRKSIENGGAIVAATGGSTNAALHLPALANEAGIAFTLDDVGEVFARTPLIGDLRPGGKFHRQGCLRYRRHRHHHPRTGRKRPHDGSCLTVSGRTLAEEYGGAMHPDGEIVLQHGQTDHARWRPRGAEGQSLP